MIEADAGSLHDPHSRVVHDGARVLRLLTAEGLEAFEAFAASSLAARGAEDIVATTRLAELPATGTDGPWVAALEHERVPVISYPHEWTFGMLRDAALLHLDVVAEALAGGLITKDATPYNVQFVGSRPLFIDVGSFERLRPGEPWYGYRQFCQLFLNPLLLAATTGVGIQTWLAGSTEGVSPVHCARLLPRRVRMRPSIFPHVTAHAWMDRRYARRGGAEDVSGELRAAGLGPAVLRAQVRKLQKLVTGLRWHEGESTWSGYGDRAHYTPADLAAKEAFVRAVAGRRRFEQVLDLGANDGHFSEVAADHADHVVALDLDAAVVERLYRRLRARDDRTILPLVADVADLPGGMGWAGRQRPGLLARLAPDLVLALAVVHHLAISRSIPLGAVVDMLASFGAEVVVEFPCPTDPMVQRLLGQKRAAAAHPYSEEDFAARLGERFDLVDRVELPSGHRVLHHVRPR